MKSTTSASTNKKRVIQLSVIAVVAVAAYFVFFGSAKSNPVSNKALN